MKKKYALKMKVSSKLKRAFNVSHFVVLRCIFQMHVTKCLHHITSTKNLQKYPDCILNKKQSLIFVSGGECTLVVREPPAGPKKIHLKAHQRPLFQKFCQFRSHAKNLSAAVDFSQGIESKQRMHFWIGPDIP